VTSAPHLVQRLAFLASLALVRGRVPIGLFRNSVNQRSF
jgi:hypothetical protein